MGRALLIDREKMTIYNFVCALANHLNDKEAALEMLGPALEKMGTGLINHAKIDPGFDAIRDDPRFKAMLAAAEPRVASDATKCYSPRRVTLRSKTAERLHVRPLLIQSIVADDWHRPPPNC